MANTQQHKITSDWTAADKSANRLEMAATDERDLVAIRSNHNPDQRVYATTRQVTELARAANQGTFQNILGGSPSGR